MKSLVYFLAFTLVLTSCVKEDIRPQQPNTPQPIITDTTFVDVTLTLAGQTWVITKVLNTDFSAELRSDTLVFINSDDYKFNGNPSKYKLYLTPTTYKLSLYDTPWGNFSGSLFNYNIVSGRVDGLDFYDILNTSRKVKLWMRKI
jgi:hypothetical protein